eukprot:12571625-Alexandrium_andersonii.AAC.1
MRAALRAGGEELARWLPAEGSSMQASDQPYFSIMQCGSYVGVGVGCKGEGRKRAARIACVMDAMTEASTAGRAPDHEDWARGELRDAW